LQNPDMTTTLRVAGFLNAAAGTVTGQDLPAFRDRMIAAFAERGVAATLEIVPGDRLRSRAEDAAGQAARKEIDAVVVGGGDGSISAVAGVLAGTGIPLGILPLGTLNHFAAELGIPTDIDAAVAVIAAAAAHPVDLGEVNGRVFVNNSSIGFYPFLVLARERRRLSGGHAKWVATALACLQVLRHLPIHRLSISAEGRNDRVRTPCLFVGNNRYDLTSPALVRRERLDRGELWLCVARRQSRLSLIWLACRLVVGGLDRARDLQTLQVGSAEISSRKGRLLVAADGEVEVMRSPLLYRSRPGALRVFLPPATEP
jgi:diacylglycerol kinase family enzyme